MSSMNGKNSVEFRRPNNRREKAKRPHEQQSPISNARNGSGNGNGNGSSESKNGSKSSPNERLFSPKKLKSPPSQSPVQPSLRIHVTPPTPRDKIVVSESKNSKASAKKKSPQTAKSPTRTLAGSLKTLGIKASDGITMHPESKGNKKVEVCEELGQENDEGNIEFKLKLINPTPERFQHLVTQMKYRLQEGQGEAIYELGVQDNGHPRGLSDSELKASIDTINRMATELKCDVLVLRIAKGEVGQVAELLVRKFADGDHVLDIRICVAGNVDSGKSTLIGVLTRGILDNGRGLARLSVFRHRHELESGRTSSISHQIIGFDSKGNTIDGGWSDIVEESSKVLTFIDLAGHERYLKTTVVGLSSQTPDYALIAVAANNGVTGMAKQHIALTTSLNIPVFVVVTKIDICPAHILQQTLQQLEEVLATNSSSSRKVMVVKENEGAIQAAKILNRNDTVPIFLCSNVTGDGLELLKSFLNLLPKSRNWSKDQHGPVEFSIDEAFNVTGVGVVVSGTCLKGMVKAYDSLFLGPFPDGRYEEVTVKSIHVQRTPASKIHAGQSGSLALKKLKREQIRKGMVLVSAQKSPTAIKKFEASFTVMRPVKMEHSPVAHVKNIRQSVAVRKLSNADEDESVAISSSPGDRVTCFCEFLHKPEHVNVGDQVILREGKIDAVGKITQIFEDTPRPANGASLLKINGKHSNGNGKQHGSSNGNGKYGSNGSSEQKKKK